ncbi:DUF1622 domain-containing protein [Dactylosporangium roseum]|uniref:DUF1622 domain-containing protein n=1 Tax=Dactylosporangium roseum TaxID=47989 RepID=A0ABY5ZA64_9ACTN|nr:DUF1622 domain-containing protein [Dactylosporangium roseum]UWZ38978.1 DUF1622 domain-containing protein [Dactylosporangium roseum]
MNVLLGYAALGCIAAGLFTGGVTLAIGRDLRAALCMALDFWLAAGLLRLGGTPGWQPLMVAATIVAVRQLVGRSLRRPPVRLTDVLPHRSDRT